MTTSGIQSREGVGHLGFSLMALGRSSGVRHKVLVVTQRVFSYGTLRQPEVQVALFGREIETVDDSLSGWRLEWLTIVDPDVIKASGSDRHPILRPGGSEDSVEGAYLVLEDAELPAVDDYEVSDYVRIEVTLASGVTTWVYVGDGE